MAVGENRGAAFFILSGLVKALLCGVLPPDAAGRLFRGPSHKYYHMMHMAVELSAAIFIYKSGKFLTEMSKITAELPRLSERGFFAVGHTVPGTQATIGIYEYFFYREENIGEEMTAHCAWK